MKLGHPNLRRCLMLVALVCASTAGGAEDQYKSAWTSFQAAVAHDDKAALVSMMRFPVEWENLEIRSIPSEADFLKRYSLIFTEEIKKEIAHAKPEKGSGGFSIDWKGRGKRAANSYSLIFKVESGGRFSLDGLYEGPRD